MSSESVLKNVLPSIYGMSCTMSGSKRDYEKNSSFELGDIESRRNRRGISIFADHWSRNPNFFCLPNIFVPR
jgi:hypothetical protein